MTHLSTRSGDWKMLVDYGPHGDGIDPLNVRWQFTVRYVWREIMISNPLSFIVTEFTPEEVHQVIREMFSRTSRNSQAIRFFDNVNSEIRRMETERRTSNPWRSISSHFGSWTY